MLGKEKASAIIFSTHFFQISTLARQRKHVQNRELLHYARLLRVENPMSSYLQAIE
jgi:DNA mismatch repair ATPase MutS